MSERNSITEEVTIVGAGLVGSLLALYLSKVSHKVNVYEKRPDPRQHETEGRSINLAVSERAWSALRPLGLEEKIKSIAIPMYGRQMHHKDGSQTYQPYSAENNAIYSTSRKTLNDILISEAEATSNVSFHFDSPCSSVTDDSIEINGHKMPYQTLFGTDGANSAVRQYIEEYQKTEFEVDFLSHSYLELNMPPQNNTWALKKNALHIWPRKSFMLIALPNPDGSFTCTLFLPNTGPVSFASIKDGHDFDYFIKTEFPDAYSLLEHPKNDFDSRKPSKLATLTGFPWTNDNNVCLLGDAAHAIVPFYGQGMNAGFEDCLELFQLVEQNDAIADTFGKFQQLRKKNTDAIAELALKNFIEMRDLVADESFLLQKKIDSKLHELHPDIWNPLYNQVSFTTIPYHEALNVGRQQEKALNDIMDLPEIEKKWSENPLPQEIIDILTKYNFK